MEAEVKRKPKKDDSDSTIIPPEKKMTSKLGAALKAKIAKTGNEIEDGKKKDELMKLAAGEMAGNYSSKPVMEDPELKKALAQLK